MEQQVFAFKTWLCSFLYDRINLRHELHNHTWKVCQEHIDPLTFPTHLCRCWLCHGTTKAVLGKYNTSWLKRADESWTLDVEH